MSVAKLDLRDLDLDLNGLPLAGGKIYTYAAGTSTPLATYTDSTGLVANANPIILDASGQAHIWLTCGTGYKFVFKDAGDGTLYTENGISVADPNGTTSTSGFLLDFCYHGASPPLASEWLGGHSLDVAVTFPAALVGAFGHINTNPTASFVLSLRKNATSSSGGTQVGTVTVSTGGAFTFATTAGATQSFAIGDHLSVWGPGTADATANDFNFTLIGTVTA